MFNIEKPLQPRKNVPSGFWLVLVVPFLLLQTGYNALSMELLASSLAFIIMYEKSLLKFSLFPTYSLFFHCLYFIDSYMALNSVFIMVFVFFSARELLILFPYTFSHGEALLISHISATFIITQPLFLFAFLLIFIIERYSLGFNMLNIVILLNLTFLVICFYFTYQYSPTILLKKALCFITTTNFLLVLSWLLLFLCCLAIIYYHSTKQTRHQLQISCCTTFQSDSNGNRSNGSLKSHSISEQASDESEEFLDCNLLDPNTLSSIHGHPKPISLNRPPSWYRKIFHFAAGMVFSSGVIYSPHLLQICSTLLLLVFWIFEWARRSGPQQLRFSLDAWIGPFRDERDAGTLIFTPMALLLGLSLPIMWPPPPNSDKVLNLAKICQVETVHPSCWAGIISIAVGDSFAALIGRAYGKRRWPGTHRTFLGSFASLISQIIVWLIIAHYSDYQWRNGICPILAGVLIEAYTEQIDNLVVPLIMMNVFYSGKFIASMKMVRSI